MSVAPSEQIRRKLSDLANKRASLERQIGESQSRRSKKETEASSKDAAAAETASDSMRRSHHRQAETARKDAARESTKIADLQKRLAAISRDEGTQSKNLMAAEKSEASARVRAGDKSRRDRERAEKRLADQRRAEDRRRQQEAERVRRADMAHTQTLIEASEYRLQERIAALTPRQEELRVLYATASSRGDLRVDEEIRRVKAAVRASTHRDHVKIEHLPAATAGDLLDGLTAFRPHVVHFSGHGSENILVLDDGSAEPGDGHTITARAFKSAVEAPDEPPALVVLNACKSAAHGRASSARSSQPSE